MSTRQRKLTKDEIGQAFESADGARVGPILTLAQLAAVIGVTGWRLSDLLEKYLISQSSPSQLR